MPLTPEHLRAIDSYQSLAKVLYDELNWPEDEWKTIEIKGMYGLKDLGNLQSLSAINLEDQQWGIFLADFKERKLERKTLRRGLSTLAEKTREDTDLPKWPVGEILFVCRSEKNKWSFVRFTGSRAQAKISSFGWSDPLEARTAIECLNKLTWGQDWDDAWAVEKLTKDFFTKLSELFFDTISALDQSIPDENERRLFVQKLFNRLIFLRFVEKKGWLKLSDRKDYLRELWERSQNSDTPFWPTRLNALFQCVNTERPEEVDEHLRKLVGTVYYLNGGLFEEDKRFVDPKVNIPSKVFEDLLGPTALFYKYNFTVEESSPLDVQVAVDPEILGKIFERLTISEKRHDTGSYYTPREIVQFMCREALVGYLEGKELDAAKARKLVYEHDDDDLGNKEGTLAWNELKAIKVVDPACGSGAYLLGMLQELYSLFELLKRDDRKFSDDPDEEEHKRKLHIIENNIYGVDLQEFATNTAMLRLWLTLLVEDKGKKPQPLPNLEYKIERGDALLGPDPSQPIDWTVVDKGKNKRAAQSGLDLDEKEIVIAELRRLRAKYQDAHGEAKIKTKAELELKLAELRGKVTGSPKKDPAKFDWRVEFFDVFLEDPSTRPPGFDAVLANPPYIRMELFKPIKPALRRLYPQVHNERSDIYCYFYARAVELLRPGGWLAFISSDKWLSASYGEKLRAWLSVTLRPSTILDFGDLPVFQSTSAYPVVFVAQRVPSAIESLEYLKVKNLEPPYPNIPALVLGQAISISSDALTGSRWRLHKSEGSIDTLDLPTLGTLYPRSMHYGIKTGLNKAFYITSAVANSLKRKNVASQRVLKQLVRGEDVRRWKVHSSGDFIIYMPHGVSTVGLDNVMEHLRAYRARLEARATNQRWYELQQPQQRSVPAYEGTKIVYPQILKESRFALDKTGAFPNQKCFAIATADLSLLGILNSKTVWQYLVAHSPLLRGGYIEPRRELILSIPIPPAPDAARAAIEALVQQILDAKDADPNADVSQWEAEIDKRVEYLYFHQDEFDSHDAWQEHLQTEEHALEQDTRALIKKGEGDKIEFKASVIWDTRQDKHNLLMRDIVVAEICAFLNAEGGTVLCGVADDKTILGLKKDLKHAGNPDKLGRLVTDALGDVLQPNPIGLVKLRWVRLDGHDVLRVDVTSDATRPYESMAVAGPLTGKKRVVYVRDNGSAKALDGPDLVAWWHRRQPNR